MVGVFVKDSDGTVSFNYSDSSSTTPISLSLPREAKHAPGAALAYLDNLLPDNKDVRKRWAKARGLHGTDPFTLMTAYGEDVAGAVSLSTDPYLPDRTDEPVIEASDDDIAERIASLRHTSTSWIDPRVKPRMSLAGMQGKFTLAKVGDRWFWPSYEVPSTHILKPPSKDLKSIELFESASLGLAKQVGIRSSLSTPAEFIGQPTFIVERWDRANGIRLPAEDLNQALGSPTASKYDVKAPAVARLLDQHGQAMEFVRQLAFNVSIGNADAHAKNYSVLLAGGKVALAPLYDTVPVHFWPKYSQRFAMQVGSATLPVNLNEANWRLFASEAGLDQDMVCETAFGVMSSVAERYRDVFEQAGADQDRLSKIAKYVKKIRRAIPGDFLKGSAPPAVSTPGIGEVWVQPHTRADGTEVDGYYRNLPKRNHQ